MEKGKILFLEPGFETLWTIVKSSMMDDIILTKKKWKWHQKLNGHNSDQKSESDTKNSGF